MADRKESFSLDGLLGGDFWSGVDKGVKRNVVDAVVKILGQSGALTEAQAGLLNVQREKAVLDSENGKLRQAGFRPGQYVSQRQRAEAIAFAKDPESAQADKLARLQFKGGMVDGRFVTNYDEWKTAGNKQHTGADGQSLDRKWTPDTSSATARFKKTFAGQHWKEGADAWVARSGDAAGGDYRSVRLNRDGTQTFTFGKENSAYNKALRNQRVGDTSGEWIFNGSETNFSDRSKFDDLFAASKGGDTMRERGWLDAVFARAERAAARGGRTRR